MVFGGLLGAPLNAADELPVREGLEFHLDVTRLGGSAAGKALGEEGVAIETWSDVSGNGRDARQATDSARPRLVQVGDSRVVRFDGVDDHLRVTGIERTVEAATVFIVAAPRSNGGAFRGFLAVNERGRRDYESGFTIDQGPGATPAFSQVNVEGKGFQGASDVMSPTHPFGGLHVLEVVISPEQRVVGLAVDGTSELSSLRPFEPSTISIDELTIGARYYTNGPGKQQVRGFGEADLAEVLVYSRELSTAERDRVRGYLESKHADLRDALASQIASAGGTLLESIADPPPVQLFVPGFTVRQLPVSLPNINNVRYRPDGKLLALAYDGDVYLLTDTDGDGIEDKADVFWDNDGRIRSPIGMALTPPGYEHGQGLFAATKSECILITDTDGDDRADKEITVATGWPESFHNVDALGVAVDPKDHSIYFGLGTANFAEPYLKDKEGKPGYELGGERSSILKVSPDFSKREAYCSGIRFPVALAFNAAGDLFATDQEGATWVPNGNPFDELLHIQPDRHYGFPPRHPRLLPNVVDEPSTYNYTPQHQSICGLFFNEPLSEGGRAFGPDFWRGDALTCGYSRGKLYRTKLARTPAGYVADNRLIASLDRLTVDSCVTPDGSLVISTHSGGGDWGEGPGGKGQLYKIRYEDQNAPQPVVAWAAAANEVRIAFDRPLDPKLLGGLTERTKVSYGEYVRAGDAFEFHRPGYEVVARQIGTPRFDLPVYSAQITPDRRTLILATDPHPRAVWYAIELPAMGRPPAEKAGDGTALPQLPRVDLDYTLGGVAATWVGDNGLWTGWLPHLDLAASRTFTAGSAEHETFWSLLDSPGTLRLQTQIDLTHMLRARVQPGSELDYELTSEQVTVTLTASQPFTLNAPGGETAAVKQGDRFVAAFERETTTDTAPVPIEIVLASETGRPELSVAFHTAESSLPRPVVTARFLLPWAKRSITQQDTLAERVIPELEGGSWARGREVFLGETAACSKCHAVRGMGGTIGPDLSNLVHRDYASVFRDVTEPSYAINPDYISHAIVLKDGRVLTGTLRGKEDKLLISDTEAKVIEVSRDEIEELAPSTKSIMPDGLPKQLGPEKLRDLLTFLLKKPPHMPIEGPGDPPPARPREEVAAILAGAPEPPLTTRPIEVVLVAGPKDHGPGEHDYPAWQKAWSELLSAGDKVEVSTAWEWPEQEQLKTADVLVFYQKGEWTPERAKDIDAFLKRGGGLVYIHYAVDGGADAPGFAQRIGLAWKGGASKFRHGPLELGFRTGSSHPIGRNFDTVKFVDESYWQLVGDPSKVRLLASGVEDGKPQPLFWTIESGGGRVFVSIPGHYSWTFDDPLFRILLLRGIAWTANEPVDRFNDLATMGARVTE